jgi:hypothetical protein
MGGLDVKVHTVAADYLHAESRKSLAFDDRMETIQDGRKHWQVVELSPQVRISLPRLSSSPDACRGHHFLYSKELQK